MHGPEPRTLVVPPGELPPAPQRIPVAEPPANTFLGPKEVLDAYATTMSAYRKMGLSKDAASKKIATVMEAILGPLKEKNLSQEEVQGIVDGLKLKGPVAKFADVLVDVFEPYRAVEGREQGPLAITDRAGIPTEEANRLALQNAAKPQETLPEYQSKNPLDDFTAERPSINTSALASRKQMAESENFYEDLGQGRYVKKQGTHLIFGILNGDSVTATRTGERVFEIASSNSPNAKVQAELIAGTIQWIHNLGFEAKFGAFPEYRNWKETVRELRSQGVDASENSTVTRHVQVEPVPSAEQRTLEEAMQTISKREQKVIRDRMESKPLEEIGKELGVTRERVRQIEEKALAKIREVMGSEATGSINTEVNAPGMAGERIAMREQSALVEQPEIARPRIMTTLEKLDLHGLPQDRKTVMAMQIKLHREMRAAEKQGLPLDDYVSAKLAIDLELAERAGKPLEPIMQRYAKVLTKTKEYSDANEILAQSGEKPLTATDNQEVNRAVIEQAREQVAQDQGNKGLFPEIGQVGFKGLSEGGLIQKASDIVEQLLKDDVGAIDPTRAIEIANQMKDRIVKTAIHIGDEFAKLKGEMFPAMTRISQKVGESFARLVSSKIHASLLVPRMIDTVLKDAPVELRVQAGATMKEFSVRYAKEQHMRAAVEARFNGDEATAKKHEKAAADMVTFVGAEGSPLTSEESYQASLRNPQVMAIIEAYKKEFVPYMLDRYRKYKGMEDDDPVESFNQVPDMPINFLRIYEGQESPTTAFMGGGRGNLKNPKERKLIYDQTATRAHDAYELDLAKIMEATVARSERLVNLKVAYESMVEQGLAERGQSGMRVTLENGDKTWELPNVKGGESLYISDRIKGEARQALEVDEPMKFPITKAVSDILTRAALGSTVEAAYHSKNLLTSVMRPGVNPFDIIKNGYKVVTKDSETIDRLVDLGKIGAGKEEGFDSGVLWGGKTDPTVWASKFLHIVDRTMRLTMDDAFQRNVRAGRVENTETNRRDTINVALGQYNKAAQQKIVVLLRDLGIGPFATAGTKFYIQGLEAITMSPGTKASSAAQAVGLRAEVLAKTALVLSAVAFTNYKLWGNVFGDDNTPLGAVKVGETADGKTTYLDLTAMIGLTRGMRETGLLALSEGVRRDESASRITDNAMNQIYTAALHPAMGPPVTFAHTLITGKGTFGEDVTRQHAPSGSHAWESLRAALIQANPIVETFAGAERHGSEKSIGQKGAELLGPYAPKFKSEAVVNTFKGALEELREAKRAWVQDEGRNGLAFPQERELRILMAFNGPIQQYQHAMRGDRRAPGGAFLPGEGPEDATKANYRSQMERLARTALERIR